MLDTLRPFAVGLVTFLALDLVWIGVLANQFYKRELAGMLRMDGDNLAIRLGPALVLYPLIILGLQVFALPKATPGDLVAAAFWGGLFGFIGYGVYDLTNFATLATYSLRMTVVDMLWGLVLSGSTAVAMMLARP